MAKRVKLIEANLVQSEANKEWISSTCNYGENFISSIRRGNVHAVQFHPEKSGGITLRTISC